jgi:Domain of unknown function (DUF5615)
MRLLLDNNLSPRLVELLTLAGWDVAHVRALGLRAATDKVVLEAARNDHRVLVSADTDFGALLAGAQRVGDTGSTLSPIANRRRLSMVTAQLGIGISRSPLRPDFVDGNRSRPMPVRRMRRHCTSTVAASRSTSDQPSARQSRMRQPIASIIRVRSTRSQLRAFSLAVRVFSHSRRSPAVRARGCLRGVLSIRPASRTGFAVTAPCRAA